MPTVPTRLPFGSSVIRSKLGVGPLANFIDERDGRLAVKRLGVQDFVVAQRHGVLGQRDYPGNIEGKPPYGCHELGDQAVQIVGVLELDSSGSKHRLKPLLDRLLSVKAD